MSRIDDMIRLSSEVASDKRLKATHVALIFALCRVQLISGFQQPCNVSRADLMKSSHIKSPTTYHKVLTELQLFGYIVYHASFHPAKHSSITLSLQQASSSYKEAG